MPARMDKMTRNKRVYMSDGWHTVSDQEALNSWLDEIDGILRTRTGYGMGYYPDIPYNDLYKAGIDPIWAACIVLGVSLGLYPTDCRALRQELGI